MRWVMLIMAITGFALLYVPLVILVIYSFNASQLVSVWGGWSTRWYVELWSNEAILDAAVVSLKVAVLSATLGTAFGTLIGYILSRFGGFRLRTVFTAMATAPIVMPEVVTGLSLLLLFISMEQLIGWPAGRSITTIVIAHATFGMAFVAVVIQTRLAGFDRSIEEAARDLGARQPSIFLGITLPVIAPAIVSGWLLAFTLSLDDLVIASFVSGQGSSTLPMVIYSKVRLGVSPDVNALGTIVILAVAAGLLLAVWVMRRGDARRKREEARAMAGE